MPGSGCLKLRKVCITSQNYATAPRLSSCFNQYHYFPPINYILFTVKESQVNSIYLIWLTQGKVWAGDLRLRSWFIFRISPNQKDKWTLEMFNVLFTSNLTLLGRTSQLYTMWALNQKQKVNINLCHFYPC